MKMSDIQKKSDSDLTKIVSEKREELRKIRFETAGSGMRNTNLMKGIRHEIAQALTELNKRTKAEG